MPAQKREVCTTYGVYSPWPRPDTLAWTRSRRQRDYIYSFCYPDTVAANQRLIAAPSGEEGRKRPIRIVAGRRRPESAAASEWAGRGFPPAPLVWILITALFTLAPIIKFSRERVRGMMRWSSARHAIPTKLGDPAC